MRTRAPTYDDSCTRHRRGGTSGARRRAGGVISPLFTVARDGCRLEGALPSPQDVGGTNDEFVSSTLGKGAETSKAAAGGRSRLGAPCWVRGTSSIRGT